MCETLCAFLALPYDDAMLRFTRGCRTPASTPTEEVASVSTGFRDWQSQMDAGEVECFEAAAGDLLGELGYPRAAPVPSERN